MMWHNENMTAPVATILIVADNDPKRQALTRILERAGYAVRQARSEVEALHSIETAPLDLLLLDVDMHGLNGANLPQHLSENPATTGIPILHISAAHTSSTDRARGFDSGADGYLAWPVDSLELLAWIRALLRMRAAERSLRASSEKQKQLITELQTALSNVKTLRGLLPICAGCKKIRDDSGYWDSVERYLHRHCDTRFSHGLCPDCMSDYGWDHEPPPPGQALPLGEVVSSPGPGSDLACKP